jgi:hypothetical protein
MWEFKAPPELRAVLRKLEERFGLNLKVRRSEPQWLTFQVIGMTDEVLIRTLEREHQAFFGPHALHHQVLKHLEGREPGISVSYSAGLSPHSGFWYY